MIGGTQILIKCPLCGKEFEKEEAGKACAACGKKGCGLIKCPNCGYEFPLDKTVEVKK